MFLSFGANQFVKEASGKLVQLDSAYMGHGLEMDKFPEGELVVFSAPSCSIEYGFVEGTGKEIFRGTREELAIWNEKFNGW